MFCQGGCITRTRSSLENQAVKRLAKQAEMILPRLEEEREEPQDEAGRRAEVHLRQAAKPPAELKNMSCPYNTS